MITNILNSVKDFEKCIMDGTLKVCFLHEGSKISKKGWAEFVKPEELYDTENISNNLGISLVGSEYPGASILTCIDIDGDKRELNGKSMEKFSKDWAYQIIKNKLDEYDVKYMAVRSSSGGYHIYLYTITESMRYESTKGLSYPKDLNDIDNDEEIKMFLSGHMKELSEIFGEELPKTIVEVWCNKRYMVAPGSEIYDDDGKYIGTVELLPDGVQEFKEISTLKESLNDLIREAFIENGFKENPKQKYVSIANFGMENKSSSSHLNDFSIQNIGNLLVDVFPLIDGQKHTATLALGGYLYNKGISLESIEKLGDYVVENLPEGTFKSNEAFINTLKHDAETQDPTRLQTGLPTFEEIFAPYYSKEIIGKKLHLATNPAFHKFWPDGRHSKKFNEIIINHTQNYIIKNIIQTKVTNDGEIIDNKVQNYRIEHSIEGIIKYDDISNPEKTMSWERPVQILFRNYKSPIEKSKIYQTPDELFREYRKLKGVYTDHAKSIIEDIYREYEILGFIQNSTGSTKPGIWYDKKEQRIRKYIKEDNQIVEVFPQKPTKTELSNALLLLLKINEVYPWNEGKFGFFVKTALTMPYAHVLKYYFDKHHPSIILHGEAGTLKTTAAELIVNFNIDSFKSKDFNIISGGELTSEYRFGRAMDASSFPLVANETETLFRQPKIRELVKDSVTGKLIRKPGGNYPYGYYSHRASIYTMNTLPITTEDPAFLRRFIPIEFDKTERGDIPEVLEKFEFLNEKGIKNSRFRELAPIGDFVFYLLSENMSCFNNSIEYMQDFIITNMESYTDIDLSFMKQSSEDFVYIDRTDQENTKLSMLLQILRRPYNKRKAQLISGSSPVSIVKKMIDDNTVYPYINKVNDDNIILDTGLKNEFNNEHIMDGTSVTLKGCLYLLNDLDLGLSSMTYTTSYVIGRKKQVRGIKMSIEDFTKILANKKEV